MKAGSCSERIPSPILLLRAERVCLATRTIDCVYMNSMIRQ